MRDPAPLLPAVVSLGVGFACLASWVGMLAACHAEAAARIDSVAVHIDAHDTQWSASYVLGQGPDKDKSEVPSGREIHVPLGADVRLQLTSRDFICLFAMPGLGLHDFAAPGLPTDYHFRAERAGSYELKGDEMCGLPHGDKTRGRIVVEDAAAFRAWVQKRAQEARK